MVLVDPVMGDNGNAYGIYTEGLREKMLQLVGNAHVITPILRKRCFFYMGKKGWKKICQPFGTGWKEKAGTDRKDWSICFPYW